ncbi:GPO family capsid scaffolding protein [Acerihabitans arboris]|uniref:Phage capsid protein n=1 Tax=Acerihabitans arboris TaxID=2691583 RepID=A0A845SPG1_9GAMM|nr:GPO family capsid scaffolding protein [Acerihabitans arboris]NDL64824.1 phage capsid protein [Acerihabitans arboris]
MPGQASQLMTDFIRIATEGQTVDGRNIPAQWLTDMAATYDPALYTALIWPEHERWWGNFGEVLELKAEPVDGLMRLFARLRPSIELMNQNARGQLLFSSIEPTPTGNFRGSGKCYLEGLGVTDSPASVGTDRIRFSAEKNNVVCGNLEPFFINNVTDLPGDKNMSDETKPNWRSLFGLKPKEEPATVVIPPAASEKPFSATPDQLTQLAQAVADLEDRFSIVESSLLETVGASNDAKKAVAEVRTAVDEINAQFRRPEAKELFEKLPDLMQKFAKLDEVITKLPSGAPATAPENIKLTIV